jgi:hypothetical protein
MQTMTAQVERYRLHPFATMLDAGGATAANYHLPRNYNFQLVVIDGAGKIAYSAGSIATYMGGPESGTRLHQAIIEKSLRENSNGILGEGVSIPSAMELAAQCFNLQQFGMMEQELARVLGTAATAEHMRFAETLRGRVAETRRVRLKQIETLAAEQPVQAYREALIFADAFKKSDEAESASALAAKLRADPKVKPEIDAEFAYQQTVAPEISKVSTESMFNAILKPVAADYLKKYGETGYAIVVRNAIEDKFQVVRTMPDSVGTPPAKDRRGRGGL